MKTTASARDHRRPDDGPLLRRPSRQPPREPSSPSEEGTRLLNACGQQGEFRFRLQRNQGGL